MIRGNQEVGGKWRQGLYNFVGSRLKGAGAPPPFCIFFTCFLSMKSELKDGLLL